MRRFAIAVLLALLMLVLSVSAAFADSPHFLFADSSVSTSTGALTVSFKDAGLGTGTTSIVITLKVNTATAVYQCFNNGGNHPKAGNKETVSTSLVTSGTFPVRNGQTTGSLTVGPPSQGSFACPSRKSSHDECHHLVGGPGLAQMHSEADTHAAYRFLGTSQVSYEQLMARIWSRRAWVPSATAAIRASCCRACWRWCQVRARCWAWPIRSPSCVNRPQGRNQMATRARVAGVGTQRPGHWSPTPRRAMDPRGGSGQRYVPFAQPLPAAAVRLCGAWLASPGRAGTGPGGDQAGQGPHGLRPDQLGLPAEAFAA